jgi:hypothetical protein
MARNEQDPAASTQQFRAFATRGDAAQKSSRTGLVIGLVVGIVVVLAVIAILVLG